jgi:rod shape-determining protein MreC
VTSNFRRIRDVGVVLLLLAIPFFVLRANVRDPRKLSAPERVVLRLSGPLQSFGAVIGRQLGRFFGSYVYLVDVKADNEKLSYENAQLRAKVRELEAHKTENERLRRMLSLRETLGPEALSASVIAKEATEFRVSRVVLDKPSNDVKPGWPVRNDEGVVGVVMRAEGDQLEVQLAIDPQIAIDVIDERTGARGLARGTSDVDRYACKIEYMRRSDEVAEGDLLVTSGVGARFAKGIAVARITKIKNRGFGEFQEVEAEPVVSFSRLQEVFVVPPQGPTIAPPLLTRIANPGH